jgi:hypothetical protein
MLSSGSDDFRWAFSALFAGRATVSFVASNTDSPADLIESLEADGHDVLWLIPLGRMDATQHFRVAEAIRAARQENDDEDEEDPDDGS